MGILNLIDVRSEISENIFYSIRRVLRIIYTPFSSAEAEREGGLNEQSGFSLIETVVSIGLLGILVTLSVIAYTRFFDNPKILLRNEALYMANQEITNAVNKRRFTDTTYTNINGNLAVERNISDLQTYYKMEVAVIFVQNKMELVKLSADIKK